MRYRKLRLNGWKNRTRQAGAKLALLALGAVCAAGCRVDMHVQPKLKPDDGSTFFQDGRANRPEIPDTVARGHMRTDELLYTGKVNGVVADQFPFPVTQRGAGARTRPV